MALTRPITKEEAYDLLSGTIAKAFEKGITRGMLFGSDYEKGQFQTVKNLLEVVNEINEQIVKVS